MGTSVGVWKEVSVLPLKVLHCRCSWGTWLSVSCVPTCVLQSEGRQQEVHVQGQGHGTSLLAASISVPRLLAVSRQLTAPVPWGGVRPGLLAVRCPLALWSAMPCFWLPASVCNSCILVARLFCFPHLHFCTACFVKASLLVQVRWFLLRFSDWSCSTKWNKGRRWRECKDAAEMFLARGCDLFPLRQRQTLEANFSMNVLQRS